MLSRAKDGTCLETLVRMAMPLCKAAQDRCPRTGPGRPPEYQDWQIAVLIMVSVLKKRKSKSSQWRFICQHPKELCSWLGLARLPCHGTYFQRYRQAESLFQVAIRLQGHKAEQEGVTETKTAAVDKSLLAARGPQWPQSLRRRGQIPKRLRGLDREATWGYSPHHGWVYGYSYEVLVSTVSNGNTPMPLLASAGEASRSEHRSFASMIPHLSAGTQYVLADTGYDNDDFGEAIEHKTNGARTGRRFICPPQSRAGKPAVGQQQRKGRRERRRQNRLRRWHFYRSRRGHRLYALRSRSVEPFNQWFKHLFELDEGVWHRGLKNNQTHLLAALFCYQLLLRYAHRRGQRNGRLQWILDAL